MDSLGRVLSSEGESESKKAMYSPFPDRPLKISESFTAETPWRIALKLHHARRGTERRSSGFIVVCTACGTASTPAGVVG